VRDAGTNCMEGEEPEIRRLCLLRLRECDIGAATVGFKAATALIVGGVNTITDANMVAVGLHAN
jgi:hypothetical protein